jgi:hypothetical protein
MHNSSRLEIFPDELLLDLFSYIPPTELYHVWYGLNHRFSAILRSVRISFDLNENTDAHICALNYFSQQIVHIHIRLAYKSLDLKQFPNLRSLLIDTKLTNEQLSEIQPNILPHLKRLTVSEWWKDEEPLNDIIFNRESFNEQRISWLKVYHLPSMPNYFLTNITNQTYIRTMIFDRVNPYHVNLILSSQIFLRRLKVTVVRWMPDDTILKHPSNHQNDQHKHLIYLDATMNTCNKLDDLYLLLSRLACLRHLHIACDSLTMNDFKQLAFELNRRVPWLERLSCSFKQTRIENIEELHCMSPLFRSMKCRKVEWAGVWHYYCVTTENV